MWLDVLHNGCCTSDTRSVVSRPFLFCVNTQLSLAVCCITAKKMACPNLKSAQMEKAGVSQDTLMSSNPKKPKKWTWYGNKKRRRASTEEVHWPGGLLPVASALCTELIVEELMTEQLRHTHTHSGTEDLLNCWGKTVKQSRLPAAGSESLQLPSSVSLVWCELRCPLAEHLASCHISTNQHRGTGCNQMHIKNTAVCARGRAHVDPPLLDFCVFFHFVSVAAAFLTPSLSGQCVLTNHCLSPLYCGITVHIPNYVKHWLCFKKIQKADGVCAGSEQTWLTCFLSSSMFVRCQHPEAVFPSWSPSLLFSASPLGLSTQHTPHTRLWKRRMWRNMWVSPLYIKADLLLTLVCPLLLFFDPDYCQLSLHSYLKL